MTFWGKFWGLGREHSLAEGCLYESWACHWHWCRLTIKEVESNVISWRIVPLQWYRYWTAGELAILVCSLAWCFSCFKVWLHIHLVLINSNRKVQLKANKINMLKPSHNIARVMVVFRKEQTSFLLAMSLIFQPYPDSSENQALASGQQWRQTCPCLSLFEWIFRKSLTSCSAILQWLLWPGWIHA